MFDRDHASPPISRCPFRPRASRDFRGAQEQQVDAQQEPERPGRRLRQTDGQHHAQHQRQRARGRKPAAPPDPEKARRDPPRRSHPPGGIELEDASDQEIGRQHGGQHHDALQRVEQQHRAARQRDRAEKHRPPARARHRRRRGRGRSAPPRAPPASPRTEVPPSASARRARRSPMAPSAMLASPATHSHSFEAADLLRGCIGHVLAAHGILCRDPRPWLAVRMGAGRAVTRPRRRRSCS